MMVIYFCEKEAMQYTLLLLQLKNYCNEKFIFIYIYNIYIYIQYALSY